MKPSISGLLVLTPRQPGAILLAKDVAGYGTIINGDDPDGAMKTPGLNSRPGVLPVENSPAYFSVPAIR